MLEQEFESQVEPKSIDSTEQLKETTKPLFKFSDTMGTFLFVVLNIISAGISGYARMYLLAREANEMRGVVQISRKVMLFYFAFGGISLMVSSITILLTMGSLSAYDEGPMNAHQVDQLMRNASHDNSAIQKTTQESLKFIA